MIGDITGPALASAASLQGQPAAKAVVDPAPKKPPNPVTGAPPPVREGARLSPETALVAQEERAASGETALSETGADGLTPAEERIVQALRQRDAEVRRHEQAHAAAGGAYAGAPQYEYTTGPDGKRYAVGGHVRIDTGSVAGDPQATIQKLQTVKRAALAPGNPSPQDRRVAAQADQGIAEARQEAREERAEEAREQAKAAEEGASGGSLDVEV